MNVEQFNIRPCQKAVFTQKHLKFIPDTCGCYVLTNINNITLYIGKTKNLRKRCEQHLNDKEKTSTTKYGKCFWFYYMEYENTERLERTWLNEFEIKTGKKPFFK